jgi:hypothetical protein
VKVKSNYFKAKGKKYSINSERAIIAKSTGLIKEAEPARANIYQNPQRNIIRKQRCTAIAHKRQGYPNDRHYAKGHADVHEKIDAEHEGDAKGKQSPEVVFCLARGVQSPQDEQ